MSYIQDISSARFSEAYNKHKKSRGCKGNFLHVFLDNRREDKLFSKMYHLHLMGTDTGYRLVVKNSKNK